MASHPPPGRPARPARGLVRRTIRRRGPEIATRSLLLSAILLGWAYVAALSRYEASILIRVEPAPGSPAAHAPPAAEMATLAHLAGSKRVLDAAAADPAVADLPGFRRSLQVAVVPGMPLLSITARGTPDQAPRIASAIAGSIERARLQAEEARRATRDARLRALRDRSERADRALRDYARRVAALEPGEEVPTLDVAALASDRLAADLDLDLGLEPASADRSASDGARISLGRLRPAGPGGGRVTLRPAAMAWFWAATFPVVALCSAAMLAVAVACESRRSRTDGGRGSGRGAAGSVHPRQGTMLVAIELVHGDWQPGPRRAS